MAQIKKKFIGTDQVGATKIRLENNTFLRGRNAANSADISGLKINASDKLESGVELNMGAFKITNLAAPTVAGDAARKADVDAVAGGNAWKDSARAATTAALPAAAYANGTAGVGATLTGSVNGALPAQDGITLVVNDRLLVKNQASGFENGVYVVTQVGNAGAVFILTRATDSDESAELLGLRLPIEEGTVHGKRSFRLETVAITVGTTALVFSDLIQSVKEDPTLIGGDITNQYKDFANEALASSVMASLDGVLGYEGSDYTLSTVAGVTRLTFAGDWATGGLAALVAGDILHVQYIKR